MNVESMGIGLCQWACLPTRGNSIGLILEFLQTIKFDKIFEDLERYYLLKVEHLH